MTSRLVSRNQISSATGDRRILRITLNTTPLYTVPADTVATIDGATMQLDAVGADATYALAIRDTGGTFRPIGAHVAANGISQYTGKLTLRATETVSNVGDAGSSNGTCDIACNVQEFPG